MLSSRAAFAALGLAFLLHNLEEAITICLYPVENPLPIFQPVSCKHFLMAVSFISVAGLFAFVSALQTKKPWIYYFVSTGLASVLLLNVFVPHLLVAIYTFHYTPGLVSALFLNFPLSMLVLYKNRVHYSNRSQFFRHIFIFLMIGYLVFACTIGLVKLLF